MTSSKAEFDKRDVSIVIVSFAEPARLVPYQDHHDWPFTLLADPDRHVYRAFALKRFSWFSVFSPSTLLTYFKLLRKGQERRYYGTDDIYQAGGDFLVDREGNILFAHRGQDPGDRPPPGKLLETIDQIVSTGIVNADGKEM